MTTKTCSTCNTNLEITNFNKRYVKKDGTILYRFECRQCQKTRNKNWRIQKQDLTKKQKKEYREKTRNSLKHIAGRLISFARKRAKKNDLNCEINVDELHIPENCPVLGLKLQSNAGGIALPNSYSLDRLDNSKGYTKENVRVISYRANSLKNNGTFLEHIKVAKYINTKKNIFGKIVDIFRAFFILTGVIH